LGLDKALRDIGVVPMTLADTGQDWEEVYRGAQKPLHAERQIVERGRAMRPDVVVVFKGYRSGHQLRPEVIQQFKPAKTVFWSMDDPWFLDRFTKPRGHAKGYDQVWTCATSAVPAYRAMGIPAVHMVYPAFDEVMWRDEGVPEDQKDWDVSWVGSSYRGALDKTGLVDRAEVAVALDRAGMKVGVWGPPAWKETPARHLYQGRVGVNRVHGLYCRTRVNLNSHIRPEADGYLNSRCFELLGCGAFMLTDKVPGMERTFDLAKHCVTYRSQAELIVKAKYYVRAAEERAEIAAAGKAHVLAHHTYKERAVEIVRLLGA